MGSGQWAYGKGQIVVHLYVAMDYGEGKVRLESGHGKGRCYGVDSGIMGWGDVMEWTVGLWEG